MKSRPDKTFDLRSSTDLYLKLHYDVERLCQAEYTKAIQYAAFDCAVIDVVRHVSQSYLFLSGTTEPAIQ